MPMLMVRRNRLKLVHFASTLWFALSAGYLLVLGLLQTGKSWWVIVSLSGYSTLIAFLLISLYLFSVFRGVARSQKTAAEHPLTTSVYYLVFYDISPFLGTLAGALSGIGITKVSQYTMLAATGSLWATFLVWIVIDPLLGSIEMLLPSSRKHRRGRLAQAKAMRQQERLAARRLLSEARSREELERTRWNETLRPYAEKLAALAWSAEAGANWKEAEAVDIGVSAWQMGGLNCMRQLHSMAMDICKQTHPDTITDYISIWWDGIGSWRCQWPEGKSESGGEFALNKRSGSHRSL